MTTPTPSSAPAAARLARGGASSLAVFGVTGVIFGALGLLAPAISLAASSAGGEEFMSTVEAAPPNVVFLVDLSSDMGAPCHPTSGGFTNT